MPIDLSNLVGYAAAILTTVAFFPQVLKSWQTRDLSGVSLTMYSLFTAGGLWLVYGLLLGSWPIIVANAVTLALAGLVLVLKVKHGTRPEALREPALGFAIAARRAWRRRSQVRPPTAERGDAGDADRL